MTGRNGISNRILTSQNEGIAWDITSFNGFNGDLAHFFSSNMQFNQFSVSQLEKHKERGEK